MFSTSAGPGMRCLVFAVQEAGECIGSFRTAGEGSGGVLNPPWPFLADLLPRGGKGRATSTHWRGCRALPLRQPEGVGRFLLRLFPLQACTHLASKLALREPKCGCPGEGCCEAVFPQPHFAFPYFSLIDSAADSGYKCALTSLQPPFISRDPGLLREYYSLPAAQKPQFTELFINGAF